MFTVLFNDESNTEDVKATIALNAADELEATIALKAAEELGAALKEFQAEAKFKRGALIVFGCSTSEILGAKIGAATSAEVAGAILPVILEWANNNNLYIAIQCCEHLNRSLVVEAECAEKFNLEEVNAIPYLNGGGGLSAAAMTSLVNPVLVDSLMHQAHGGADIGNTFIGMHLRRVAVCVRLSIKSIGFAQINCVKTRPMLVGGNRAKHHPL